MSIETEICLRLPPNLGRRLTSLPWLKALPPRRQVLRAVYFDTPQGHLRQARAGLRVRRESGQWVQTFKQERSATERLEINQVLGARSAKVPALEWPAQQALLVVSEGRGSKSRMTLGQLAPQLSAQFETQVRRTSWQLPYQGSLLELAFDRGEVRAPAGGTASVHELEIELKEGQPEHLWQLALDLSTQLGQGLVLEPRAKAARGYDLIGHWQWPSVADVSSLRMDDHRLDLAFKQTLGETVEAVSWQIVRILETLDSEGPHQLRVALRRLRSVMKLVRPLLSAPEWQSLEQASKALAGRVGPLRDLDVFAEDVLKPLLARLPTDEDLSCLSRLLEAERSRARATLRDHLQSAEVQRFLLTLAQASGRSLPALATIDSTEFARAQLRRLSKRVRRREEVLKQAPQSDANAEARHELRLAYKALRYAAGWLGQIGAGPEAESARRRASKRQEQLGEQQDASMALKLLDGLLSAEPAVRQSRLKGMLEGWLLAKGLL